MEKRTRSDKAKHSAMRSFQKVCKMVVLLGTAATAWSGTVPQLAISAPRLEAVANTTVQIAANVPYVSDALRTLCAGGNSRVLLLVEKDLISDLRAKLDRFASDLCADGYTTLEKASTFQTPGEVRTFLAGVYNDSGATLKGAILIGNLPHAYQWVSLTSFNPDIPSMSEEVISFQYYADLDGFFSRSAGYASPNRHPYSYDVHAGKYDWEIWIG